MKNCYVSLVSKEGNEILKFQATRNEVLRGDAVLVFFRNLNDIVEELNTKEYIKVYFNIDDQDYHVVDYDLYSYTKVICAEDYLKFFNLVNI